MKTLEQLLKGMAMHLNGDLSVPSGDEYELWVESLNQSQDDWADMDFSWPQLKKTSNTTLLLSGTSVALPSDFVKLDGFVSVGGSEYGEIRPEEINLHESEQYVIPDMYDKSLFIYPASVSEQEVKIRYIGRPNELLELSDKSLCPSDNFLIFNSVSKILLQRDNQKFAEFQSKADDAMTKMINITVSKFDQYDSRIKNTMSRTFTIGVD